MKLRAPFHRVGWLWLVAVLLLCGGRAEAQNCQAMMNELLSGGSDVRRGMELQNLLNTQCSGQQQQGQPAYTPPTNYPVTNNKLLDKIITEHAKISEFVQKGQPLRQDIPLSAGTVRMETVAAPPPAAPENYVDPFASSSSSGFPRITESIAGPVKSYGSIWDPNQWVKLSPSANTTPTATQQPGSGVCGPYAAQTGVCRGQVTGFGK